MPHLAGFRSALTAAIGALDPVTAADTFVIVPTRAAGEQLRRTVEDRLLSARRQAIAWPGVGPRPDFYRDLASRVDGAMEPLSAFDREVLLGRVARESAAAGTPPPFAIRPALVAEIVALYDHIRRQARTIEDFDRNLRAELEPAAESDRGAAALLAQTAFLTAVFGGYEAALAEHGLADEHVARKLMLASTAQRPLQRVVVAVADRVAEPEGLWPADFTLLSMLPGLTSIDVVVSENMVAAGFLERVHAALPGIVEETWTPEPGVQTAWPTLVVPSMDGPQAFAARDREEELAAVARRIKAERRMGPSPPLHRTGLVVRRPLPYLYLARSIFGGAGIPFETLDTLPLAAEPYASAVDLVLDFVASGYARGPAVALLRSPHFEFDDQGEPLTAESISALDRALAEVRYLGGADRLALLTSEWAAIETPATRQERRRQRAGPAARVIGVLVRQLAPLADPRPIASQLPLLRDFLNRHRRAQHEHVDRARLRRVSRAVGHAIDALAAAYATYDPRATASVVEIAAAIRRWLGAQTFAARTGERGLQILDADAARFADLDDVQLVGLVEGEWPERSRRNIFYPPFLLNVLEPSPAADDPNRREGDARRAAKASFRDLLTLAASRVRVSTFALESDAVVEPSAFVDELSASGLTRTIAQDGPPLRVFADEALSRPPVVLDAVPPLAASWARLRLARPGEPDPRFQGEAGPWILPRVSVSRVDRYLKCPFQFFASEVLQLEEEPGDEDLPPPWERGRFLHAIFETFFREWQARKGGRIGPDQLPAARDLLVEISERALAGMPPAEAALERLRLRGSAAHAGIIDRVLSIEVDRDDAILNRLIEYALDDVFEFRHGEGTRAVRLRAKIDRVDVLADGTFRVIDYKSRLLPDTRQTVQLQVYTSAVAQQLRKDAGAGLTPGEAFYLSMEGEPPTRAIKPGKGQTLDDVLEAAEQRMVQALDDIGAGHFPPRPVPRSLCRLCPFDKVCRKAFVEAADE